MTAIDLGNRMVQLVRSAHGQAFSFAELCEKAAWYADWAAGIPEGSIPVFPSAIADYNAQNRLGRIVSRDPAAAVPGGRAFMRIGSYGHVVTPIGNGWCINSSPRTLGQAVHLFGAGLYISPLADYMKATGAGYLGSTAAHFALDPWSPSAAPAPAPAPTPAGIGPLPDVATGKRIMRGLAARHRYGGPVNGVFGPNTWKGIQLTARYGNRPYGGPIDGVPGPNTIRGVQGYAQRWGGYKGAIDGVAGPNTWACFARALGQ